jgi:DNA-binding NtrC family response regulator
VDDDSSTVNLYSNRLEHAGFRTASASDAEKAFEALNVADLIIWTLLQSLAVELLKAIISDQPPRHAVLVRQCLSSRDGKP